MTINPFITFLKNDGKQLIITESDDLNIEQCRSFKSFCSSNRRSVRKATNDVTIIPPPPDDDTTKRDFSFDMKSLKEIQVVRCCNNNNSEDEKDNNIDKEVSMVLVGEILWFSDYQDIQLSHFELFNCHVDPIISCKISKSLAHGMNQSLISLSLDYNHEIGNKGLEELCKGLYLNKNLKKLSLQSCGIDKYGMLPLASVLSSLSSSSTKKSSSSLATLDLSGNAIELSGLEVLTEQGLLQNQSLQTLLLSNVGIRVPSAEATTITTTTDNKSAIGDKKDDYKIAITLFAKFLVDHPKVSTINLTFNTFGAHGAAILADAVNSSTSTKKRLTTFSLFDDTIPNNIFTQLNRSSSSSSAKGKSKGGKSKKKKK